MSATLKDLAPAEKQKVARLIRQVVEKERAIKELEAAAGGRAEGNTDKADQLAEQNLELARENTSLRAKLSHAFELLRTYQHKCRVLDATVQITDSRPVTPGCPPHVAVAGVSGAAHAGVDAEQLAGRLDLLGCQTDSFAATPVATAGHFMQADEQQGAAGFYGSLPLSPVAEGAWEGMSPGIAGMHKPATDQQQQQYASLPAHSRSHVVNSECVAPQHPPTSTHQAVRHSSTHQPAAAPITAAAAAAGAASAELSASTSTRGTLTDGIQLVQHPLPQLETLKLLAQALMEAQAEVAARQQHQQQAQQVQQAAAVSAAALRSGGGGALLFDASLGPHGGFLINPLPAGSQVDGSSRHGNSLSVQPAAAAPDQQHQAAGTTAGQWQQWQAAAPAASQLPCNPAADASGRPALAKVQRPAAPPAWYGGGGCSSGGGSMGGGRGGGGSMGGGRSGGGSRCNSRPLFDDSLMDLVDDVENNRELPFYVGGDGGQVPSRHWSGGSSSGGVTAGGGAAAGGGRLAELGRHALYEENDLLDLINQL